MDFEKTEIDYIKSIKGKVDCKGRPLLHLRDSTLTRVVPLMNAVCNVHKTVELANFLMGVDAGFNPDNEEGALEARCNFLTHPEEKTLPAKKEYLKYLAQAKPNIDVEKAIAGLSSSNMFMRRHLLNGNPLTVRRALKLIEKNGGKPYKEWPREEVWACLEGDTHYDIYMEGYSCIFVGEAKRTESKLTSSTSYNSSRHQIIRDIDDAYSYHCGKTPMIVPFFIFDEKDTNEEVFKEAEIYDESFIRSQLSYYSPITIGKIMKHLVLDKDNRIKVVTFQQIAKLLNLSVKWPDTVYDIIGEAK
jgi:hypothetical protein